MTSGKRYNRPKFTLGSGMPKDSPHVYRVAQVREIERRVETRVTPSLMERAGRSAAEDAVRLVLDRPGPILVVCGPGNNGGDGFVLARHLHLAGRSVVVAFADDTQGLPMDAANAYVGYRNSGGEIVSSLPAAPSGGWAMIVDAMFGIGLTRDITDRHAEWIRTINAQDCVRLALDVPSGLEADTGRVLGCCINATHTTTFIALKPGLLTLDGPDHAGIISVQPLDLDPPAWVKPCGHVASPQLFRPHLQSRRRNTHKGHYGDVMVIGGDTGMTGAALLAARAALRIGAGKVRAHFVSDVALTTDWLFPELMLSPRNAPLPDDLTAIAIGPGLGMRDSARAILAQTLGRPCPLVLDADALNLVAHHRELREMLVERGAGCILTPHPAEAARLLGTDTSAVQTDRLGAAQELAQHFSATVVLKGCGSVIAQPDGAWWINRSGHPGMACAGMGDVLTGIILSLLAQQWPTGLAACAGVHLHGAAADRLAREGIGPVGLSASELSEAARGVYNGWLIEARHLLH